MKMTYLSVSVLNHPDTAQLARRLEHLEIVRFTGVGHMLIEPLELIAF